MVSIAFFTSRSWVQEPDAVVSPSARPRLTTLSLFTVAAIWMQLIMGAAFRHSGIRLLPHIVGAVVVFCLVSTLTLLTIKRHRATPQLARPAVILLTLLLVQISLGLGSYVTRVMWSPGAPAPLVSMIVCTVAHVACGALVLVTTLILTIQIHRHALPALHSEGVANKVEASEVEETVHA
jgi:heme A synthase